jgi:hypothetical protein
MKLFLIVKLTIRVKFSSVAAGNSEDIANSKSEVCVVMKGLLNDVYTIDPITRRRVEEILWRMYKKLLVSYAYHQKL